MRAFFIAACVISLIYIVVAIALKQEVESSRQFALDQWLYNTTSYDDYGSYNSFSYADEYDSAADRSTVMAGIISVFYMIISVVVFLLSLMKVKTITMKVLGIIGLSISGIFMLWAFFPMVSPGAVSFDEIGPAFTLAGVTLLAFDIVGVVHAVRMKV